MSRTIEEAKVSQDSLGSLQVVVRRAADMPVKEKMTHARCHADLESFFRRSGSLMGEQHKMCGRTHRQTKIKMCC